MVLAPELITIPQLEAIIEEKEMSFDVIILGGGPAGLTAGIYTSRAGFRTLIIEKALLGGTISTCPVIENYPGFPSGISGAELGQKMEDQARKFGVEIVWGECISIEKENSLIKVQLADKIFSGKSLIIATGTEPKKLSIPGEDKFRGRGVSYCAVCDGAFYKNKNIAVVGGGNSAAVESVFLTKFASRVALIHRRDKLRADKILADRLASHPKIFFIWNSVVEEILGSGKVEEMRIRNVLDDKKTVMKIDGVFVYIGQDPNTDFLKNIVDLTEDKFVAVDSEMKTKTAGIFAAGDVSKKSLRQIATAIGDGAIAANSVRKYLENMV